MVEPAEYHLEKTGSQQLHHSWMANSDKNAINRTITSERSISQSINQ